MSLFSPTDFSRAIIRHVLLVLLCVLALAYPIIASATPEPTQQPTLLVLGDSLAAGYGIKREEGWVALLQDKLKAEGYAYHVVNASISGETTEGGLSRLPALITEHHPDVLLLELGANDGLRGFPVKIMNRNLGSIITLAKKNHARVLLIGIQLPLNYGPRYTSLFEQTFVDVSRNHKVALVPSLLGNVPLDQTLMQEDRLHPNALAQPKLLDHVWPWLKPLLKK